VTSYLLSSTFVPVLSVWLLRNAGTAHPSPTRPRGTESTERDDPSPTRERGTSARPSLALRALTALASWRWVVVPAYLALAALLVVGVGGRLGREIFRQVDG